MVKRAVEIGKELLRKVGAIVRGTSEDLDIFNSFGRVALLPQNPIDRTANVTKGTQCGLCELLQAKIQAASVLWRTGLTGCLHL